MLFIFVIALCYCVSYCNSIDCIIGYGQRGKVHSYGIAWTRTCPFTTYCFEAATDDIEKVKQIIDFPWNSYYYEYYVRSCGGDYGTPAVFDPFTGRPKFVRAPGFIKLNITVEPQITGQGGTVVMGMNYLCRKDLCDGAATLQITSLSMFVLTSLLIWVLY